MDGRRTLRRLLLLSAGALLAAVAVPPMSMAAAADCSPPGFVEAERVARADRPNDRSEVTQYIRGGIYRVTRCDSAGNVEIVQTVAPILDPDGGTTMVPIEIGEPAHELYFTYGDPTDPGWSQEFRLARKALMDRVIPPTPGPRASSTRFRRGGSSARRAPGSSRRGTATGPRARAASDQCSAGGYSHLGGRWANRYYQYRVNLGSFGNNEDTRKAMINGHHNWDYTYNDCGFGDQNNITSDYLGTTGSGAHSYADGNPVVDKGNMSNIGCGGALACAYVFGGSSYTETDQRFSDSASFTNTGVSNAYDYQSVATHESGHSIGLGHANSSSHLTMYYQSFTGTTMARTLARGDVLGMRALYP